MDFANRILTLILLIPLRKKRPLKVGRSSISMYLTKQVVERQSLLSSLYSRMNFIYISVKLDSRTIPAPPQMSMSLFDIEV